MPSPTLPRQPDRTGARLRPRLRWPIVFLAAALALVGAPAPAPEVHPGLEYSVKAGLLFQFCRYVEWPRTSVPAPDSPLRIGLLAEDPVAPGIQRILAGKLADAHPLDVILLTDPAQVTNCHLCFLSREVKTVAPTVLAYTRNAPVLSVGEFDGFIERGGLINFQRVDENLQLEGAVDTADRLGLKISGKLARTIRRHRPPP